MLKRPIRFHENVMPSVGVSYGKCCWIYSSVCFLQCAYLVLHCMDFNQHLLPPRRNLVFLFSNEIHRSLTLLRTTTENIEAISYESYHQEALWYETTAQQAVDTTALFSIVRRGLCLFRTTVWIKATANHQLNIHPTLLDEKGGVPEQIFRSSGSSHATFCWLGCHNDVIFSPGWHCSIYTSNIFLWVLIFRMQLDRVAVLLICVWRCWVSTATGLTDTETWSWD